MLPQFPFSKSRYVRSWSNYLGTISGREIPLHVTPDVVDDIAAERPHKLARHGAALRAILGYAFEHDLNLRTRGSRWSASNVLEPGHIMLDTAHLSGASLLRDAWLTADYRAARPQAAAVLALGGTHIAELHRTLARADLALQTSGASSGQRIAGCIATGCHGSAIDVGAMHDTVLGIHLMTGPERCILLQPRARAIDRQLVDWLAEKTGIPTEDVVDDELFGAAQVALGSLGVVLSVVLEAVPLYRLKKRVMARPGKDAAVWSALQTLDTLPLHPDIPERPHHFEVVLSPYPVRGRSGAFVQLFWKSDQPDMGPGGWREVPGGASSELLGLLGALGHVLDSGFSDSLVRTVLQEQLEKRYVPHEVAGLLPGAAFGPTTLPEGYGMTSEIAVGQLFAVPAARIILEVLGEQAGYGRHLLGAVALRFVPATRALLGMNIHPATCFIELPAIRNEEVMLIYRACWEALRCQGIPFTCHWGQLHELTPALLQSYYGDRVTRWRTARETLLPEPRARDVFATPLLGDVGLD